ncbi:TPA: helix-turn-helix transcriptional regulator [Escherichia coli]|nr:helix-turn-helix transcriptional regulator [Escherichia coli]
MSMIRVRTNRVTMLYTGQHEVLVTNLSDNSQVLCNKNSIVIIGRNVRVSFSTKDLYVDILKKAVFFDYHQIIALKKILDLTHNCSEGGEFFPTSEIDNNKIISIEATDVMKSSFDEIVSSGNIHDRILSFLFFCKNFNIQKLVYPLILFSAATTFCNKVIDLIELDLSRKWTLRTLSEEFNMTEIAIRKRLESEGIVFREMLMDIRMKKAMSLLIEGNGSISKISDEIGYNNTSYFIAYFKKFFGITPKQFQMLLFK